MKIKSTTIFLISVVLVIAGCKNSQNTFKENQFVRNLLAEMTLEEKVGQMQQLNGAGGSIPEAMKQSIVNGQVGSILNEVDVKTVNELQRIAIEESRLGIPLLIGRDVIHGFKTIFPIPLGQAATWNPEIVERGAQIAAIEARSSGVNWTFAPMIDISRDARWGRIAESLGEDPYLTSVLGSAMIYGFQGELGNQSLLACAKHFAGYGASEGGRDYNTTLIPETELRNIYLPPFNAATEAGVGSFMTGFNDLNGVPASGNKFLLRTILRDEWKFEGFVVSDWASITEMQIHGFVADKNDAALKAIEAGVDMEMVSEAYKLHLAELVKSGTIDESFIDKAVYNILKAKYDLGLFDNPYIPNIEQYIFAKPEFLEAAKEAAIQSFVLLKNEGLLPFDNSFKSLAVLGPMVHQKYEQLGTWIFDGDSTLSVTPLEAIKEKFGADNVYFNDVLNHSRSHSTINFNKASLLASKSDAVIICVGEESILSGEAHCRANINLPGVQEELIKHIAQTGKPIVLVILAGRPLAIGNITEYADAVFYGFHPGTMTGAALADLLAGDAVPSGKLPLTFPKTAGQIPIYYNHKNTGRPVNPDNWMHMDDIPVKTPQTSLGNTSHYLDIGYEPLYHFGYGLSYTQFAYSNLKLNKQEALKNDNITVSIDLKNVGEYDGTEIVQLYIRDHVGSITRPVKELKDFRRVNLKKGESKTIQFTLTPDKLAFYNQQGERVIEEGKFSLWVVGSSISCLKTEFEIK